MLKMIRRLAKSLIRNLILNKMKTIRLRMENSLVSNQSQNQTILNKNLTRKLLILQTKKMQQSLTHLLQKKRRKNPPSKNLQAVNLLN